MDELKIAFAVVNVGIWTGIFLYLLRLSRRLRDVERLEEER